MQAFLTSLRSRRWTVEDLWPVVAAVSAAYFAWGSFLTMSPAAVISLGAFVGGALLIGNPFYLIGVFIFVLFTRPVDFFPALEALQPAKMPAMAALLVLGFIKLAHRDLKWARSPMNVWISLLTVAWVISAVFSHDRSDSISFFANVMVKITILWFLLIHVVDNKRRAIALQTLVCAFTCLIGTYALVNKIRGVVTIEGTRAAFVGYLGDPNDLCLALLIGFPFLVEATLGTRGWKRFAYGVLMVLTFAGILATQSRGGLLGLSAGMYFLVWRRLKSHVLTMSLGVVALAGLVTVAGIGDRQTTARADDAMIDTSAQGRLDAWVAGGRMLRYHPITGVGINQVAFQFTTYAVNPVSWRPKTSHNMFVQCAAETGLTGLIPFCMLVLSSLHINWRLRRKIPPDTDPLEAAFRRAQFSNMIGVCVSGFFLSVAWYWFPYILFAQAATSERIWLGLDNREGLFDGILDPDT